MRWVLFVFAIAILSITAKSVLITEYEWQYFDYDWETTTRKEWYARNGLYIPQNMVPIDVDRSADKRIFITVIRAPGVPASLHTVSSTSGKSGPLLKPYPSWSWYESKIPCDNIISVYRVAIDDCHRLWVLDTGSIQDEQVCNPKLMVFDLHSDELLLKEEIEPHVARNRNGTGLLVTPIVETSGYGCHNATVYMADAEGSGLVIWNDHKTVRLEADILKPEDRHSSFFIEHEHFRLAKGIFGMALAPKLDYGRDQSMDYYNSHRQQHLEDKREKDEEGDRYLYFQPLASRSLFGAETKVLKSSFVSNDVQYFGAVDVLPSQASSQAFSSGGTLFYGLTEQTAIGCWNFKNPMVPKYFKTILTDHDRLQFISGMKVKVVNSRRPKEYLLILTNRLQKIHARTLNVNEINFRILTTPVQNLIEGTICDGGYMDRPHY